MPRPLADPVSGEGLCAFQNPVEKSGWKIRLEKIRLKNPVEKSGWKIRLEKI
jgi:hypothetical protein